MGVKLWNIDFVGAEAVKKKWGLLGFRVNEARIRTTSDSEGMVAPFAVGKRLRRRSNLLNLPENPTNNELQLML